MGLPSAKLKYRISFISIEIFYGAAVLFPILYVLSVAL
jgi:hypothetical protein